MKKYLWIGLLFISNVYAQAPIGQALPSAAPTYARVIHKSQIIESTGLVGYRVTYEYGGKHYTVQTVNDPGERVAVQIQTMPIVVDQAVAAPLSAPTVIVPPTQAQVDASLMPPPPPVVVYPYPVYVNPPPYAPSYIYSGPHVSIGLGWGWGEGRWHRHWRH